MIDVSNLSMPLDAFSQKAKNGTYPQLAQAVARALGVKENTLSSVKLLKRSVDARKKSNVHFIVSARIQASPEVEKRLLNKAPKGVSVKETRDPRPFDLPTCAKPEMAPVVVGAGPAGLFAALYLARCGLEPVLIERGASVEQRAQDVQAFRETGVLNPNSNIQYGEGGAGTFSDGKLTTNTKNFFTPHVLEWFVQAGAPSEILWQAHPHLGSDNLPHIVAAMRKEIIDRGGRVLFNTCLVSLRFEQGVLRGATIEKTTESDDTEPSKTTEEIPVQQLILACGHSARDVFELCRDVGLSMEQKPFSVGVRIEHPQKAINAAQWGNAANHPALEAAEYKMAVHLPTGRSVYTFCMCPGGEVVAAASEEGGIVTNGMSNFARDGKNANAAVLVNVDPRDFGSSDVLAGVALQQQIEHAAFALSQKYDCAPYQAPAQTVGSFLREHTKRGENVAVTRALCKPTYGRGVVEAPLSGCLPSFVCESLAQALPLMGRKLKGFDDPGALMTAPETRSSSPVRICRDEALQAFFTDAALSPEEACVAAQAGVDQPRKTGLYPCGEGPGFAGGIMSAACDGLRVAQQLAQTYALQ